MEYIEQTHESIRLYLTKGNLDLSQFTVLNVSEIFWNDFHISFGILGESHFIRFEHQDFALNEICACTDATFAKEVEVIPPQFLAEIKSPTLNFSFPHFEYSFAFNIVSWEEGSVKLDELRQSNVQGVGHTRLSHVFPSHNSDQRESVTELFIEHTDSLSIQSVHTYPNENRMVFTETVVIFSKPVSV